MKYQYLKSGGKEQCDICLIEKEIVGKDLQTNLKFCADCASDMALAHFLLTAAKVVGIEHPKPDDFGGRK